MNNSLSSSHHGWKFRDISLIYPRNFDVSTTIDRNIGKIFQWDDIISTNSANFRPFFGFLLDDFTDFSLWSTRSKHGEALKNSANLACCRRPSKFQQIWLVGQNKQTHLGLTTGLNCFPIIYYMHKNEQILKTSLKKYFNKKINSNCFILKFHLIDH